MIRKLISIAMIFATLMFFTGCADDDDAKGNDDTPQQEAKYDYTVIFWGMGGNLDKVFLNDMTELLQYRENGTLGSNVRVVGLFKTSPNDDSNLMDDDLNGTWTFDFGEKKGMTITPFNEADAKTADAYVAGFKQFFAQTSAVKVGDKTYPMNNVDSIAKFIKMAAAKYPSKHYVFMSWGHGSGFNPTEEVPNTDGYATRSCVIDSYNSTGITADNLVAAINKSGVKIQTLFFQNCLMATLENLAAYQHCADYAIMSSEVTIGGYLQKYIAGLTFCGGDDEKMKEMSKTLVDYYIDTDYPQKAVGETYPVNTSHGFYDLSQVPALLDIVKNAASWYTDAARKDPDFVSDVASKACCAVDYDVSSSRTQALVFKLQLDYFLNDTTTMDWSVVTRFRNILQAAIQLTTNLYNNGFIFSDLMRQTVAMKEDAHVALDFSTIQSLYNQYLTQIKKMAYIRCSEEDKSIADYPYIYCSPSVNIFAMNSENYFINKAVYFYVNQTDAASVQALVNKELDKLIATTTDDDPTSFLNEMHSLIGGCGFAYKAPLNTVISYYTNSQFDQTTRWSEFLKLLNANPSIYTNPVRIEDKLIQIYMDLLRKQAEQQTQQQSAQ